LPGGRRRLLPAQVALLPALAGLGRLGRPARLGLLVPMLALTLALQLVSSTFTPEAVRFFQTIPGATGLFLPRDCPEPERLASWAGHPHQPAFLEGSGTARLTAGGFEWAEIGFDNPSPGAALGIRTHFDRHWRLSDGTHEVALEANPRDGTILVRMPPGQGTWYLTRNSPPFRLLGWYVAILTLAGLLRYRPDAGNATGGAAPPANGPERPERHDDAKGPAAPGGRRPDGNPPANQDG